MRIARQRTCNGVTRAELVVVLAVAIVVLPLAVGTLRAGGEEARVAKCLANLGTLMRASHAYLTDYGDDFFLGNMPIWAVSGFAYGGQTSDAWWQSDADGLLYIRVTERPLNEYVLGGEPQPDLMDGDTVVARTPIPVCQCPSDSASNQRTSLGEDPPLMSAYNDVGTSYELNFAVFMETTSGFFPSNELVRALVGDARAGLAQDLVWLLEDPLDFAFNESTLEEGQHGRVGWHSAGFFDGHAEYRYFDTRRWCGPGWAAINTHWVWTFGQPKPPVYYTLAGKSCAP